MRWWPVCAHFLQAYIEKIVFAFIAKYVLGFVNQKILLILSNIDSKLQTYLGWVKETIWSLQSFETTFSENKGHFLSRMMYTEILKYYESFWSFWEPRSAGGMNCSCLRRPWQVVELFKKQWSVSYEWLGCYKCKYIWKSYTVKNKQSIKFCKQE